MKKKTDTSETNSFMDYGYHLGLRVIQIDDDIDETSVGRAMKALQVMDKMSDEPIKIIINSFGGSVYDGLALYDMIRACDCEVHTYGYGKIMSMATFLLLAGDKRYVSKRATIMVHEISDSVSGQLQDLHISVKEAKRLQKMLIEIYMNRTSKKDGRYWNNLKRDTYFHADQAIELGFAHEIEEETHFNG